MAPAYKLTYYPGKGLGESIRFLLSYGGIDFEDVRFDVADWPKIKQNMPFGQVPVLEHEGKVAFQSVAIARYVAKRVKLTGQNDWEDLEIDSVVDTVTDLRQSVARYYYEQDTAVREQRKIPLFEQTLPYYLGKLDAMVESNKGFLAVGRLTWADLYFVALLDYFDPMCDRDIVAGYSNLTGLKHSVLELPAIKAWIEKRPEYECPL